MREATANPTTPKQVRWATRRTTQATLQAGVVLVVLVSSGAAETSWGFDHAHTAWNRLLQRYVHDGEVQYSKWKETGRSELAAYLAQLQAVSPEAYASWSEPEKLAFWINAYNAYTVQLVLDSWPLKSIRDIGLLPGAPFRRHFIPLQRLRGAWLSLNDIEHGILRKEFREPRIHFAIVCASKSCPELRNEAYRGHDLDRQLDEAARRFLSDPRKNRFAPSEGKVYLSRIFQWFQADFVAAAPTVLAYVAKFAAPEMGEFLRAGRAEVEYLDYDWSINGR
jgi:hypothetical protein